MSGQEGSGPRSHCRRTGPRTRRGLAEEIHETPEMDYDQVYGSSHGKKLYSEMWRSKEGQGDNKRSCHQTLSVVTFLHGHCLLSVQ
ncbi:dexamethasone-induced protein isoform 2-T10 [Amazona ochrocephala]